MKKYKRLAESKIEVYKSKYLKFPTGEYSSIDGKSAIIFENKHDVAKVFLNGHKIYLVTDVYDKYFDNLQHLADFLNKEKFQYRGIDDI